MGQYNRVLAAIDLTDESSEVLLRAVQIAEHNQAELNVIHVVEIISYAYGGEIPMDITDIQTQVEQHAEAKLASTLLSLNYPIRQSIIATGNTGAEIHAHAKALDSDLIVIGSHGRHGLSLLLGSTANGVLHGAECDILAVRLTD